MTTPTNGRRLQILWTDDQGNKLHALADPENRVPWMLDQGDAVNPLTGRRYPAKGGGTVTFLSLGRRAQRDRLGHWNEALEKRLVVYDPKMGLPPANNADAAAGTGQVAAAAAPAAAAPASDPGIAEILSKMSATMSMTADTNRKVVERQDELEDRQKGVEGTQVEHAKIMATLNEQIRKNEEYNDLRFASLQDQINENSSRCGLIESTVKTLGGDIKFTAKSCKKLEVRTDIVTDDVDSIVRIMKEHEDPNDLVKAFKNFTPKSSRKPSVLGNHSPSSQAPKMFTFEDEWNSSPPGFEDVHIFGPQTERKNFDYESSLRECLDNFGEEGHLWLSAAAGSAIITTPCHESILNSGMKINGPDDHRIMSLIVVSCTHQPTNLVVEQHTPENCDPITVLKSLAEAGLEWSSPRDIAGRTIRVLEPANGHRHSKECMSKMRLLLGRPTNLLEDINNNAYTAEFASVWYAKAKRDAEDNIVEVDGEVQYEEGEELLLNKGSEEKDAKDYVKEGIVDPCDKDAVVASAKMNLHLQAGHFKTQTLAQELKIYETLEEIAAAGGTTSGHVLQMMDEMKIAQVFPSEETLDYDALGIIKTLTISSVESNAHVYYPEDNAKPPANAFSGWKPAGYGLSENGNDDADADNADDKPN